MFAISSKNHWCRTLCYFEWAKWYIQRFWFRFFYMPLPTLTMGKFMALKYANTFLGKLRVRQKKWDHIYQERYLAGSQIPLTRGGFELQISCMKYLWVSGLDNYFAWERFEVQTLEQDTIVVWILAHGWGISNLILYYKWNKEVGIVKKSFSEIKFLTPFSNSFTFIITHASLIISYVGRRDSMS